MYTRDALLDLYSRAHRSFDGLLRHCRALDAEAIDRELEGFGYPTVRLQIHHVIGAEEYWITVLRGKYSREAVEEENDAAYPTIASLEAFRTEVGNVTRAFLEGQTDEWLNQRREVLTWPDRLRTLAPAHVIARISTHIYQHQGQIAAQCRLLGLPIPSGLDFPLD